VSSSGIKEFVAVPANIKMGQVVFRKDRISESANWRKTEECPERLPENSSFDPIAPVPEIRVEDAEVAKHSSNQDECDTFFSETRRWVIGV
jgi:hypothetical protein